MLKIYDKHMLFENLFPKTKDLTKPNNLLKSFLYSKPFENETTKCGKSMVSICYLKTFSQKQKI